MRSMSKSVKMHNVIQEMKRIQVDIMEIYDIRRPGTVQIPLSGDLNRVIRKLFPRLYSTHSRIIMLKLDRNSININLIQI